MVLTKEQQHELLEVAKPLIKWLNDNCHPHCMALVEDESVTVVELLTRQVTHEFLKD